MRTMRERGTMESGHLEAPGRQLEEVQEKEEKEKQEEGLRTLEGKESQEAWAALERERELLTKQQERLRQERERFYEEMREMQTRMDNERRRMEEAGKTLKKDELFFQQKMEILKGGFAQLAQDRKALERDKILLEAKLEERRSSQCGAGYDGVRLFFSGVSNPLTLKKRHRDLVKIFHPDNLCGDTKLLQQINRMYETMLEEVGWKKKA